MKTNTILLIIRVTGLIIFYAGLILTAAHIANTLHDPTYNTEIYKPSNDIFSILMKTSQEQAIITLTTGYIIIKISNKPRK